MDNENYVLMCTKILNNPALYRPIRPEMIDMYNEDFYMLVDNAFHNNMISKQLWRFIRIPFPTIPTFYSLPKIHKNNLDAPGRLVVLGNGAITENLSKVIDEHFRPFVTSLPSYVHDIIHLLQIIEGTRVASNSTLVTIDV